MSSMRARSAPNCFENISFILRTPWPTILPKAFPSGHLVQYFEGGLFVAEGQVDAAGVGLVDQTHLEALHGKGDARADRDRVEAVGVAVEVHLHHEQGIEDAQIRAASGDGFIFRPVDKDLLTFVRTRGGDEVLHSMGAREGAADPATVVALVEQGPEDLLTHVGRVRVAAETIIVGGEKIEVVHDRHQMGRPDARHLVLFRVLFHDLLRMKLRHFPEGCLVCRVVHGRRDGVPSHHHGPQPLVRKYGSYASAAGLFEPGPRSLWSRTRRN